METRRLPSEAFERARRFLESEARPLEQRLFANRFDGEASQRVLEELSRFANEDGGFGHGLEPDVRTPSSSALATAIALRILDEIHCPTDHPIARNAVEWLVSNFDAKAQVWPVIPADANDHPHAPWWHDVDGSLARTFNQFLIIPRALVVGLLHRFAGQVPARWLDEVTEATVRCVEHLEVLGAGGGSDLEYVVQLARAEELPDAYRRRLTAAIRTAIPRAVIRDPAKWSTYCVTPLSAVPAPDSIGADLIPAELQSHLDFVIERQSANGAWGPTWTFEYPPEWASARREWCGLLTLATLTTLRAYGRC